MNLGRKEWTFIAIAAIAIVVMAPSDNENSDNKVSRSDNQHSSGTREVGHVELERLAKLELQQKDKKNVSDAFNSRSWYVQPPPPKPTKPILIVAPPPPPVVVQSAPPIPFTYLGRYGDTASRTIILSKGDRVYTVGVGDVIENAYRVEKFTTGMINLTYLPLSIEQHLPTGEAF